MRTSLLPAPAEVISSLVQSAAAAEAQAQTDLATLVALYWFSYGGVDDSSAQEWAEVARPALGSARTSSAERGFEITSLLWSLENDEPLVERDSSIFDIPAFRALEERAEKYLDAPVVRTRYELANRIEAVMDIDPPSAVVQAAREHARALGLYTVEPSEESNRYAAAMDRGAARAVQQALGDSDRAFGIGAQAAATGKKVKRWLKVPHAAACDVCVLVSRRGYRSAESAKLAGHAACRCGTKAEWVKTTGHGSRERVRNVDWAEALDQAGYGMLDQFAGASTEGRAAILAELFPN